MKNKKSDFAMKLKNRIDIKLLITSLVLLLIDQLSKILIVATVKYPTYSESDQAIKIFGDFLKIIHVRNKGAGFSFGADLTGFPRFFVIFFIPIVLVCFIGYIVLNKNNKMGFDSFQRVALSVVFAGGCGTLIDRICRPLGVVDFISVKFYGFLGFDYWPTFNLSDTFVCVGVVLLIISIIVSSVKKVK